MTNEIIIRNTLEGIGEGEVALHLAHILCLAGNCEINYNGTPFTIREHDCTIIRATQLVGEIKTSADFRVEVIYIDPVFIEKATPNNNYGMRGSLSLAQNPVMHLTEEEFERCLRDFQEVGRRRLMVWHHFHDDLMLSTVQTLILDFFDFHARIDGDTSEIQSQAALTMSRFIAMLERGDYRQNREVTAQRPQPQFCGHLRAVQLLLTGLFQPLRPTVPGRVSFRISGVEETDKFELAALSF